MRVHPGVTAGSSTRRVLVASLAVLSVLAVAGCQSAYDLPLPGGAARGGDVFHVTAEFADVLDLVPMSSVKVNEVTVGAVESIEVNGWSARVTLRLPKTVKLPDNAVAEIRQTSLLGEKYVQLAPPADSPVGELSDGDNIPLARTGRNPEVEEVLSAMSLLLNGGGVAQLKTIESELNNALRGNSASIQDVIKQLDTFVGGLDQQKSEIVRAIDNIDKLAGTLAAQKEQLGTIIDQIPAGLKILADQRQQLTTMLKALSDLGAVGTRVIKESKADTLADLAALGPILTQLNAAGDSFPKSLQLLLTYPFPDQAVSTIKGDFTNLRVTLDSDLGNAVKNAASGGPPTLPSPPALPALPGAPSLPSAPGLPALPGLPSGGLPAVPPLLGQAPSTPFAQSSGGNQPGAPASQPGLPSWMSLLGKGATP